MPFSDPAVAAGTADPPPSLPASAVHFVADVSKAEVCWDVAVMQSKLSLETLPLAAEGTQQRAGPKALPSHSHPVADQQHLSSQALLPCTKSNRVRVRRCAVERIVSLRNLMGPAFLMGVRSRWDREQGSTKAPSCPFLVPSETC